MKFAEDNHDHGYIINAYESGSFMINGKEIITSLVIATDHLVDDWQLDDVSDLSKSHIQTLIELEPEIVIIGTGEKLVFPDIETYSALVNLGIGIDIMNTGAACRTYNILAGEGRRVVAGLIVI